MTLLASHRTSKWREKVPTGKETECVWRSLFLPTHWLIASMRDGMKWEMPWLPLLISDEFLYHRSHLMLLLDWLCLCLLQIVYHNGSWWLTVVGKIFKYFIKDVLFWRSSREGKKNKHYSCGVWEDGSQSIPSFLTEWKRSPKFFMDDGNLVWLGIFSIPA